MDHIHSPMVSRPPQGHPLPSMTSQGRSLPPIASLTVLADHHTQSDQRNQRDQRDSTQSELSPLPQRMSVQGDSRDSGNWSASKHSSGVSQINSILNGPDSPSNHSGHVPDTPQSNRLPPLSQIDNRGSNGDMFQESRRSSVDSRVNYGMDHLRIDAGQARPFYDHSQNPSRTSLTANLQQQRGIAPGEQRSSLTSPLSPLSHRNTNGSLRSNPPGARRAPVIHPNPRGVSEMPDPTAEQPTKGFPWAFPDSVPEDERRSSSLDTEEFKPSRQNSYAASVNSSIYTSDSVLPPGQRPLGSGLPDDMPRTHHHSIQHRSVTNLQGGESSMGAGTTGSYSRTPELRVSHKMAERKRRSEMKGLFEELQSILPHATGGKSSKWETLTRAIDHINKTKVDVNRSGAYRDEVNKLRHEQSALREEAQAMYQTLRRLEPNHPHIYGQFSASLSQHNDRPQPPASAASASSQATWPQHSQPPSHMQGVEYSQNHNSYDRR